MLLSRDDDDADDDNGGEFMPAVVGLLTFRLLPLGPLSGGVAAAATASERSKALLSTAGELS